MSSFSDSSSEAGSGFKAWFRPLTIQLPHGRVIGSSVSTYPRRPASSLLTVSPYVGGQKDADRQGKTKCGQVAGRGMVLGRLLEWERDPGSGLGCLSPGRPPGLED